MSYCSTNTQIVAIVGLWISLHTPANATIRRFAEWEITHHRPQSQRRPLLQDSQAIVRDRGEQTGSTTLLCATSPESFDSDELMRRLRCFFGLLIATTAAGGNFAHDHGGSCPQVPGWPEPLHLLRDAGDEHQWLQLPRREEPYLPAGDTTDGR